MKATRAFILEAMTEPVTLCCNPKDKKWYPMTHFYECNKNQIFIYGEGWVKVGKWKKETVQPFSNPYTAEQVKTIADQYGMQASFGMIRGWGACSLFDDRSYGLDYAKYEVANMGTLGKVYDEFTDVVQKVGDKFIEGLLANGFKMDGDASKGWLWYNYVDENNCGELLGQIGVYEKIRLHPLQHIDHLVGASIFASRMLPIFNSVSFDDMLWHLFRAKYIKPDNDYRTVDKMLNKIVSVHDRIEHFTGSKEIADGFEEIFEEQKKICA